MKRLFLIAAVFLFLCSSVSPVFADYTLVQYVRVGLLYGNSAPSSVTLEADCGFSVGNYKEREFEEKKKVDDKKLTVSVGNGAAVEVKNEAGETVYTGDGSVGVRPAASGMDQVLALNGTAYRGGIHCVRKGGAMTVVNVVFLDHYLTGDEPFLAEAGIESTGGLRQKLCDAEFE